MSGSIAERESSRDRAWLAALLRGDAALPPPRPGLLPGGILNASGQERVLAITHRALALRDDPTPAARESVAALGEAAQGLSAQAMFRDAECRSVLQVLKDASIQAIVTKGSALAHWLYDAPYLRQTGDIDLLLPSSDDAAAAAIELALIGYVGSLQGVAGDLVAYELLCRKRRDMGPGWEIDLHWRLLNTPLFSDAFSWDELWSESILLPSLGPHGRGLGALHSFFHACMHRLSNLQFGDGDQLGWLYDIHLLAAEMDAVSWDQIVGDARDRGLAGTCLDGLRAASREFATVVPDATLAALVAVAAGEWLQPERMNRWLYAQLATWHALPTRRQRWRWLRQRLFPSVAHLREAHGRDGESLSGIVLRRFASAAARMRRN